MKNFLIVITLCIIINPIAIYSQFHQEWVARYDNSNSDVAGVLKLDSSGNVYVSGSTTIKYNSFGIQLWAVPFNKSDVSSMAVDNDGNVYVCGTTGAPSDIVTIKYNSQGSPLWTSVYNGPQNYYDAARGIAVYNSGDVFVTGVVQRNGGGSDIVTIKYDSSGSSEWTALYGSPGFSQDVPYSLLIDNRSNVYVTGYSNTGTSTIDYLTLKYNSSGVKVLECKYNGPANRHDFAFAMAIDESENIYVTGVTQTSLTDNDYATVKYNSAGIFQWAVVYGSPHHLNDNSSCIEVDTKGNVYVTGQSRNDASNNDYDYLTIKYDSSGVEQWKSRYENSGTETFRTSMAVDANSNVYIAGYCGTGGVYQYELDYAVIKYDTDGEEQWVARYNGPQDSSDLLEAIAVDKNSNVYVTGLENYSVFSNTNTATVKYSQTIVNTQVSSIALPQFALSQNYPNPFNPETKIKYQLSRSGNVKISVFNVIGNEIEILVEQDLTPGFYEVKWNAERFSSGFYFYKITSGEYSDVRKMLLLK